MCPVYCSSRYMSCGFDALLRTPDEIQPYVEKLKNLDRSQGSSLLCMFLVLHAVSWRIPCSASFALSSLPSNREKHPVSNH